ncbi:hypothetical protein NQ315_007577 [Exocentrus adspersus]|uniref:Uncharacterized protein n=1 Tax=Exocentrus adspersus TaxID=1586481 RepID=A0AAV8W7F1_9CUCU|nr:hypothetical protein NQ315_007577 [Exocentrus adspersus]
MSSRSAILGVIFIILSTGVKADAPEDSFAHFESKSDFAGGLGRSVTFGSDSQVKLRAIIGANRDLSEEDCPSFDRCTVGNVTYTIDLSSPSNGFLITWESNDTSEVFKDCFYLSDYNWYGGPQRYEQKWPIEKQVLDPNDPYVVKKSDNFAVAERYWLNSRGAYIYVDEKVPLFVDQNTEFNGTLCLYAKAQNPYIGRSRVFLQYRIVTKNDAKLAHLHAVNNFLGKPKDHPNEKMIREPIWTTWAKFKRDIDDETVLGFANDIVNHGFTGGQVEIDEDWETCFGSHVFKPDKFSNIKDTVKAIKDLGFRVTLWINPTKAIWWEGDDAHQIDFTNPEAAEWFSTRISVLKDDPGVDGFKFDAGETDYAIPPSVYENMDPEEVPNCLTIHYVKTCAEFGDLIEVRSAWRTQEIPVFVRMIDKDSVWGEDDGLYTLITTLLQLNMNGYTMVLPDMIGGNAYKAQPSAELIIRWAEANALMPAMQFSFLIWDYPTDEFNGTEILRKFVDLHTQYGDEILKAMNASITDGTPVNPPIWWVDPSDETALACDDEFLLGESILIAPVLVEGAVTRNVYLPTGSWKDGNNGTIYEGPVTLQDYPAPIDVLPYFILQRNQLKSNASNKN